MYELPKMILFDYGQTLVNEKSFDGRKGTEAVMQYATKNKYQKTPRQMQELAEQINKELGRFDPKTSHEFQIEVHNQQFNRYLYESQGIELSISSGEVERVFWDVAAPPIPTEGIQEFLKFLEDKGIRTGIISNIAFSGDALKERMERVLPGHRFEFIIATSEYVFRKPNKRIFELALEKADLTSDQVWYCGDQIKCDMVGAKNCGIKPIWYMGASEVPLDYEEQKKRYITIQHWQELEALMGNV